MALIRFRINSLLSIEICPVCMAFRTYKIPRIHVDLDNIFAQPGNKAEMCICAMSCTVHPYFYCFCIRLKRKYIFHCIVFKSIKTWLCIYLCVVLVCGARGSGFDSRPRHLNFQILVISCFKVTIWVKYHWSDVNPQYNQPTNI